MVWTYQEQQEALEIRKLLILKDETFKKFERIEKMENENSSTQQEPKKKKCKFCGAIIPANAQKCQHCGEWLVKKPGKS